MRRRIVLNSISFALVWLAWLPAAAHAQSAIAGVVKDTSGAVLPGVTVEASSDVLIEKTRSVITDGQGQYRIVDLRPGTYVVTFLLTGFQTFRRENVELPADFTASINADMRVGTVEESVTVAAQSPIVDVQSTARTLVLSREVLDLVPTGRTIQGLGQLVVGVSLSQPDIGGSRAMQQTYMSVHGLNPSQVTVQVDGMLVNGLDGDGAVQNYFNNAMSQEMSYQTSGAGADVSGGGVRLNMIPREGGNQFSGSFFGAWSDGAWQSDNLTQKLKDRGVRAVDRIDRIYDFNIAEGGPIMSDKLWFFGSARRWSVDAPIADTFYADGTQGIDDQHIKSALVRLTWQVSPRNKFAAYYDKIGKNRGHGMNAGDDPATAGQVWNSPNYITAAAKWTSTVSNRLLVEGGFSKNLEEYNIFNQPGIDKVWGTPEWYAGASRRDLDRGTRWASIDTKLGQYPDRYNIQGSASYVTGSHNIKAGAQWTWGPYNFTREANADLRQQYRSGVPDSVVILNTPLRFQDRLNGDVGIFAQDSWTLKRLTINGGARWEYFNSQVTEATSPAGRFVPERHFDRVQMPIWKSLSPRFGVVYDLFGNAKTALKFSLNRYEQAGTYGFADIYNPLVLTSATVSWTDLNRDDIAQGSLGCVYLTPGCEINLGQLPRNFGIAAQNFPNPDIKRIYNVERSIGIQHELLPRVSVNAAWYHRTFHNLRVRTNTLQSFSDYTPVDVVSPLDGHVITMYNVSPAALRRINNVDSTDPNRRQWYDGYEFSFNARLPGGGTLFGGTTSERMMWVLCDEPSNPNNLLYCDSRESGIPFVTQFKIAGTYPLRWGIQVSGSFQALPGYLLSATGFTIPSPTTPPTSGTSGPAANQALNAPPGAGTVWLVSPTTRYAANCKGPCTPGALVIPNMTAAFLAVPLLPPGTEYADRINQLDFSLGKWFNIGKTRIQGQIDLFNALNRSDVSAVRTTNYGTAAYLQPSTILQGRIVRIGTQLKW